ncbi:S1C family serine protease [Marinicella litoralis]|uniref:Serine protease DegS/serine protease DegQ n=1 Tax=Marinicella litoralis TaxID=644220 RepID=A0A4V3DI22_9GAMM|nr:trypsin-like peptidase domain-containing protein [Marinicella litoralis]TDR20431.1 serine protease DegS/serine protease DegQ [Marinicella litoralis]
MKDYLMFIARYVVIGLAIGFLYLMFFTSTKPARNSPTAATFSYAPAIDKINPSVVSIYTQSIERNNSPNSSISPRAPYTTRNFLGAGVIVSSNGHIATNNHVIKNASRVMVYLWNNEAYEASFVGEDSLTDLAVIKIDGENLVPADFADSDLVNTGDVVLAVGNPFGLNQSASLGIVSATGRRGLTESRLENFIQTDAAINLGNSGGALINPLGQVVGISTASYTQMGADGINFAIPSNTTVQIINAIIEHGRVIRGWLGIYVVPETAHVIYNIPKPKNGIVVSRVQEHGPAHRANLKSMDVITHLNDKPVDSFEEYKQLLLSHTIGDEIKLTGYDQSGPFEKTMTTELPPKVPQ